MKLSFDPNCVDYIGDYSKELREVGLYRTKEGFKRIVEPGTTSQTIVLHGDRFFNYIVERSGSTGSEVADEGYHTMYNDFVCCEIDLWEISETDYVLIENILNELCPVGVSYVADFALMFNYAKVICYEKAYHRLDRVIYEQLKRDIRNFFSSITTNANMEVNSITIDFRIDREKREVNIDAPILIKMMLFEFAKKYFDFFEFLDEDRLADFLKYYYEEPSEGRNEYYHSQKLKLLLRAYWEFSEQFGLFSDIKKINRKYQLIGRILSLSDFPVWDKITYKHEWIHYDRLLRKYWHP